MVYPYPPQAQDDLARDRNRLAAERSLLSFVRISLTLIGLGVGLDQVVTAVSPSRGYAGSWVYGFNLVYVGLGVLTLGLAIADYRGEIKRLRSPQYSYCPRWSLSQLIGLTILATGLTALGWLGLSWLG